MDMKGAVFRIRTVRIISLLVFFLLFNAVLFGFQPLPLLLPVLQSMGTPQKAVGDAFAALQFMLWEPTFPLLPLSSFLIVTVLLGRALCSWACPFGFVAEILGYIKRKHKEISPRTHSDLIYVKYLILGAILLISASSAVTSIMGIGVPFKTVMGIYGQAPFNALSPHDTLFAVLPTMVTDAFSAQTPFEDVFGSLAAIPPLFFVRMFILVLVLVVAVYVPRSWCRYFCPVGALMALLNSFSFLGLKRDIVHCTKEGCRRCVEVCPMKVPILDLPWEKFTHPECIYCLECADACETKALKPRFP